jgi:hypothetical protein
MLIWVDDVIIFGNDVKFTNQTIAELMKRYQATDYGQPDQIIGIGIHVDAQSGTIKLSQAKYIDKILRQHKMEDCKPVATPIDPSVKLQKANGAPDPKIQSGYAAAVGSLMFLAIATRPDIAYAVQSLSQFSANPTPEHWSAIKRVFRYLQGTRDLGLTYGGGDFTTQFAAYSDADWGADINDRKSISGYVYLLSGGAISWSSKKQPTTALSSTEAEYMAATHATRHAIWLRQLLAELGFSQPGTSAIYGDNQSSIALTRDAQYHARTKHIDIRHHFIREHVDAGDIELVYCPTEDNMADILTKGLYKPKFSQFIEDVGLLPS